MYVYAREPVEKQWVEHKSMNKAIVVVAIKSKTCLIIVISLPLILNFALLTFLDKVSIKTNNDSGHMGRTPTVGIGHS